MTRKEAIIQLRLGPGINEDVSEEYNDAVNIAIEVLEQDEIIRCEDCKHHGTSNCPMWGDDTTEDYMWCCDGERVESDEQ